MGWSVVSLVSVEQTCLFGTKEYGYFDIRVMSYFRCTAGNANHSASDHL